MDPEPSPSVSSQPRTFSGSQGLFKHLSCLTGSPTRDLTRGFLDGLTSLHPLSLPTRGPEEARSKERSQPRAG